MAVTQYRAPATVLANLSGESGSWSGTGNVAASDNSRATYATKSAGSTPTLRCRNFGFSTSHIPSGSTIDGVELQIERSASAGGPGNNLSDNVVQLAIHSAGSSADRIGLNQASGTQWPLSDAYATYGGPTSLMGASITDAQARAATLAADISALASSSSSNGANIDHVRIRWYFTAPPEAYTLTANAGSFSLTGAAATLSAGRKLTANSGAFALAGADVTFRHGRTLSADAGAFTLTGADADLIYEAGGEQYTLDAEAGAFALTGSAASFIAARRIEAQAGAFALTGSDAVLSAGRCLVADAGQFDLTGADATFHINVTLIAGAGSFALTGGNATLTYVRYVWEWKPVEPAPGQWSPQGAVTSTWTPVDPSEIDWSEA